MFIPAFSMVTETEDGWMVGVNAVSMIFGRQVVLAAKWTAFIPASDERFIGEAPACTPEYHVPSHLTYVVPAESAFLSCECGADPSRLMFESERVARQWASEGGLSFSVLGGAKCGGTSFFASGTDCEKGHYATGLPHTLGCRIDESERGSASLALASGVAAVFVLLLVVLPLVGQLLGSATTLAAL